MVPGLIEEVKYAGEPPWPEIVGQPTLRYAAPEFALANSRPWVAALVATMCDDRAPMRSPTVDVRYWSDLAVGDACGPTVWHVDDERHGGGRHRLYTFGAGCPTEFFAWGSLREGWITEYWHYHSHRIQPATVAGPRLLVRVSESSRVPWNRILAPPIVKAPV